MATTVRDARLPAGLGDYPLEACLDEAVLAAGEPRDAYAAVIEALAERPLAELADRVQADVTALGITFGAGVPVAVDAVPRLIDAREWERVEAGLVQRAAALNAFLGDAYGEQLIFGAGIVPRTLLETSPGYEPLMHGRLGEGPAAVVAGFDLVRDAGGRLLVLEDNLRMPSGSSYAVAIREIVAPALGAWVRPRPLGGFVEALGAALRNIAPEGGDPSIAIVSDGPAAGAWFEHTALARALGVPIHGPGELETSRGRLFARRGRTRRRLDVIYRRMDADRLSGPDGLPTALGELLLPSIESGRLRCANAFGTGLADDKLAHAHVADMVRFYLGEEPILASVPTIDLSGAEGRAAAIERLDELVIKPRDGFGGRGVTIMPQATETERRRVVGLLRRRGAGFVAQEPVAISSHPTVCSGRLRPRRVDLRPFLISGREGATAMPGGLTRFARGAGDLVVNSSRGGGCKDTWVVDP